MPDPAPQTTSQPSAEHLAHLHKMSTTAGVTSLEYVAVNQAAVVALVFGVLSALAFFAPILLVIPVLGVAFAVVAIGQIRDSAGTQTGRAMAYVGLALSLLLGGGAIAMQVADRMSVGGDQTRIAATLGDVGKHLKAGDYAAAHALFDDEFRARIKLKQFESTWKTIQSSTGPIQVFDWNGVRPEFQPAAGSLFAVAKARVKFERSEEERVNVLLRQAGDRWVINSLPDFFPRQQRKDGDGTFELPDEF